MTQRSTVVLAGHVIWVALLAAACSVPSDLAMSPIDERTADPGQPNVIVFSPASAGLAIGQTVQLTATATNRHGVPQHHRPIAYSSTEPAVASVSATGLVTGHSPGWTDIVASAGGSAPITATARVSVGPAVIVTLLPVFVNGTTRGTGIAVFAVVGEYPHVSFDCRINGAATPCDGQLSWNGLSHDDALAIEVTAFTLEVSPPAAGPTATIQAVIDEQGPFIDILSPPDGIRLGRRGELRFSSDTPEAVYNCEVVGTAFVVGDCAPDLTIPLELLASGIGSITITGTDALGNSASREVAFRADLDGPVFDADALRVPTGPVEPTSTPDTEILFRAIDSPPFMSSPVTYRCSLDGVVVECSATPDRGGAFRWTDLADGPHLLTVIAFDDLGNASHPLEVTFEVERP